MENITKEKLQKLIKSFKELKNKEYPLPNEAAEKNALNLLELLANPPTHISPDVEGGIGLSFYIQDREVHITCSNSEEQFASISERTDRVIIWELTPINVTESLKLVHLYLIRSINLKEIEEARPNSTYIFS